MSFADIGKKSRDTLSKDFVEVDAKDATKYSRAAYEVKTKSLAGTGFTFVATRKTADPSYEGSLAIKKAYKEHGIETELTFAPSSVKLVASQEGKLVEGAKATLSVESAIGGECQCGGSLEVDYKKSGHAANLKVGQDRKDAKRFANLTLATTRDRNVFGLSAKFNPGADAPFSEATLAAQHQALDSQVSLALTLAGESQKVTGAVNVWHEYSSTSQFAAEASVPIRGAEAGSEATIRAGLQHKLADDETLKARFELGGANTRHLGLVYTTRFGAHTTVTASGDIAVVDVLSKGLSNDHVRFGFKVSLNAE